MRSKLHRRITSQAGQHAAAMAGPHYYHPYGTADTPMVTPAATLTRYAGGIAFFEELTAVTAGPPDQFRAAASGGTWGNVYQAGRP